MGEVDLITENVQYIELDEEVFINVNYKEKAA